jgi:hypothetical protein
MAISTFEIGTTYAGRANVETLTTQPVMFPRADFFAYSETVPMIDGGAAVRGWPYATWTWSGAMQADLYNALRAICPNGSASVIIRTTGADYATFGYYSAVMVWPALDSYEQREGAYIGLTIRFNKLVTYTP